MKNPSAAAVLVGLLLAACSRTPPAPGSWEQVSKESFYAQEQLIRSQKSDGSLDSAEALMACDRIDSVLPLREQHPDRPRGNSKAATAASETDEMLKSAARLCATFRRRLADQ
jgi:hypothetical protein